MVEKWLQKPVLYFCDFFLSLLAKGCLDLKHWIYSCHFLVKSVHQKAESQKDLVLKVMVFAVHVSFRKCCPFYD